MQALLVQVTACAVLAMTTGCSIAMTSRAPDRIAPQAPPDCTTSRLPIYADGAITASAMATSLFLGLAALGNSNRRDELGYATLFTFLGSIPFAISGVIGGVRVRSCRKAHDTWRMMQTPQPHGPEYAPPAPFPPPA